MAWEKRVAAAFAMSDEAWERHANPWSVWTRNTALPVLILAFWSRAWLGWWSLLPITATLLWTWLNPRLFARPRSTDNWASKSVLGERVWLNRDRVPVPPHHRRFPHILNGLVAVGAVVVIWGVTSLQVWPTLLGAVVVYFSKLWFLDRMVWLYEEMKTADPAYLKWLY